MNIIAFFTESGTPKTGLTPIINVWTLDGTNVVVDQEMSETAGGFYYYDFTTYDEDLDYVIRADSVTLTGSDRYVYSSNETAGVGKILKIEKGKWIVEGNQMKFYDADGTTVLFTFDLQNQSGVATERDVFKRIPT